MIGQNDSWARQADLTEAKVDNRRRRSAPLREIFGGRKRAEKRRDDLPAAEAGGAPQLNPADTGRFVRPPSVTEHTTELLEPSRARRGDE